VVGQTPLDQGSQTQSEPQTSPTVIGKRLKFTSKGKKYKYLAAFARSGRAGHSARQAGVSEGAHYFWLKEDEDYVDDFKFARELANDKLEGDIVYRGFDKDKPSDLLAMFHMKMLRPEYRDNYSIDIKHTHTINADDARAQIAALVERNPKLLGLVHRHEEEVIEAEYEEGVGPPNEVDKCDQ